MLSLGPIVLFFMVKPWFARPVEKAAQVELEEGHELFLRAFVYMVARSVGSPLPSRIEFDCSVNAAAGFRGGLMSILRNDVRLLIGLPLVAGLNLRSFGGILAHELGSLLAGLWHAARVRRPTREPVAAPSRERARPVGSETARCGGARRPARVDGRLVRHLLRLADDGVSCGF